jgi:cob(I)alamin adenosyltransferase
MIKDPALAAPVLQLQRGLFVLGADIASNPRRRERIAPGISAVTPEMTAELEERIDTLLAGQALRPVFLVPSATVTSAALDLASAAIRRAERQDVAVAERGTAEIAAPVLTYLNRASDLVYALARRAAGAVEEHPSHD